MGFIFSIVDQEVWSSRVTRFVEELGKLQLTSSVHFDQELIEKLSKLQLTSSFHVYQELIKGLTLCLATFPSSSVG